MPTPITSAFCVNEQWYEMPYSLVRSVQAIIGPAWTNSQIIEWIKVHRDWYTWGMTGKVITIDYIHIHEGD